MIVKKVAFFVNPLAGYGGIRNNKGSDNLSLKNISDSVSVKRAIEFLKGINSKGIEFIVPSGPMGSMEMDQAGITCSISYYPGEPSSREDTINFVHSAEETDLICFVGGDGTARDILTAGTDLPVFGIPSGVKMYSSVFAMNIRNAVEVFNRVCNQDISYIRAEVDDINEEKYRSGILEVKKFGELMVPDTAGVVISSKAEYPESSVFDIAEYLLDNMDPETYYIIGPGSTCKALINSMGMHTNMLGFDVIKGKQLISADAGEDQIYHFVATGRAKIIISIIGGQGFLLGRGNQQISHRILASIGFENICVISSREKIADLDGLSIDINTDNIAVPKYVRVLTGYGQYRIMKLKD
ncbi:MAG: ATP-NAD kinase family protein [Ferroplasma sp.]|uniref:ATP-NAD kinase family protein n=1 Tax=Ferroplasma sp. TaxID=2591003 RepID=UPI002816034C|nr:ATP-NAD kinase family protein [Ferroplasma sp.]WMT51798.1 MAG: ATP-NAD kinase family protein [Ferroplasma sp.]